jgi:nicotinamide-nucleotide amidase
MNDAGTATERCPTDDEDLAAAVIEHLGHRQIAAAESCTAGRIAAALAGVPDATNSLRGSLVAYQPAIKRGLLGVSTRGVLSHDTAEQMAHGAAALFDADVAVSTTGLAGGDPEEGVEPGTVFVATFVDGRCASRAHHFDGQPEAVCAAATRQALIDLLEQLG